MRHYEVRRHIVAEREHVSGALTDGDRLLALAIGIRKVDRRIEPGTTFTLWSEAPPDLQPTCDAFADGLAHATGRAR
jgi:hypothetical protein